MLEVVAAAGLVAVAYALALRPSFAGTLWPFLIMAVPYAAMTALYVRRAARRGEVAFQMRPRGGDLTFGAVVAGMLFFATLVMRSLLARHGSVREAWLFRLYAHLGLQEWVQSRLLLMTALVVLVAALEEIAWRGYLMTEIEARFGLSNAFLATTSLYALSYLPSVFLLADPFAGKNPLAVMAALGCGSVWGFVVVRTRRLPVAVLAHALYAWAVVLQFPLYRLG